MGGWVWCGWGVLRVCVVVLSGERASSRSVASERAGERARADFKWVRAGDFSSRANLPSEAFSTLTLLPLYLYFFDFAFDFGDPMYLPIYLPKSGSKSKKRGSAARGPKNLI